MRLHKKRPRSQPTSGPFKTLAQIVRAERKRLGLSQQELAEHALCGLTFVNQLEQGKPGIRLEKLLQVLSVLGLELHIQLGKEGFSIDPTLLQRPSEIHRA